jgi:hypothetical protein
VKKEIEHATHIPIRQQSWSGLMGAKDSVTKISNKNQILIHILG